MKTASTRINDARVSFKHSIIICKEIRGKKVDKVPSLQPISTTIEPLPKAS